MKRFLTVLLTVVIMLCSCGEKSNVTDISEQAVDTGIVGKWIDVETEKIFEYTDDGFYYEYLNEGFTSDKTRYIAENGKITYYLDGDTPDSGFSVDYEVKNGHLIINGIIEYKPMDIKTSLEETEQE